MNNANFITRDKTKISILWTFSRVLQTEHIVMTPKCKTSNSTTLIIERQTLEPPAENGNENNVHIAGGDHKGIVINKQAVAGTSLFSL